MASTNPNNPNCANCNKSGLAILPVRYAVVPKGVKAELPAPLGNKVTDVKLGLHKYALRILRQGFVYLYYEKHARGSQIKWEAYSVSQTGHLWKQTSIDAIEPKPTNSACFRSGHNIPTSVLAIEKPEKCGTVWMAFSEHAWSKDTIALFARDKAARARRMQPFEPSKWVASCEDKHALPATEANLGKVIEYGPKENCFAMLRWDRDVRVSKPDGGFAADKLAKETTRYPCYMRTSEGKDLAGLMKKVGDNPAGKDIPPAVLALWDAVGITHELAGFAHDALGLADKYCKEMEREMNALETIEGLKKLMSEQAVAKEKLHQDKLIERARVGDMNEQRRAGAARWPEPRRGQILETCKIVDYWVSRRLDFNLYVQQLWRANDLPEPARSAAMAKIKLDVEKHLALQEKAMANRTSQARAGAWDTYKDNVDQAAFTKFQNNQKALMKAAEDLVDDRMADVIAWLESPSLIAALTEFHPENFYDGVEFDRQIGLAMYGMNGSQRGAARIDAWIREMKAVETNLVWRAVALNQKEAMQELDAALAEAKQHRDARTLASTLTWVNYGNKSLKAFADIYKKFASVHTANTAALSTAGSRAFGATIRPVRTFGVDQLMATTGDRMFKAFGVVGLADHASEKIIQHILSLRAFVSPADSLELIQAQAKNDGLLRKQHLQRLRTAQSFMGADSPALRTAQAENMRKAWSDFKVKNDGAAGPMRDARLALVVMLIEGFNFNKLIVDCAVKNDAKSWWSLAASGLSITSNLFDIASVPAKVLFGNAEAWSYQRIKLAGGMLGSAASAIGAVLDARDAAAFFKKGNGILLVLYTVKALLGFASAALTAATAFTYAAPLVARLTGRAAVGAAARVIGARAAAVIGVRILCMTAGAWITVGIFAV